MPKTKKTISVKKSPRLPKKSTAALLFPVLNPDGEKAGTISLPKDIFGAGYRRQLIAQALRVYRMNQRAGSSATKTRGMVTGSTRKIYRQKGTGRARHGAITAPIFVGGGVTFGPQPKDIHKTIPKRMRKTVLSSALSYALANGAVTVISGLTDLPVKTKSFARVFQKIQASNRTLFVFGEETKSVVRGVRNIFRVSAVPFHSLNTFDIMTHTHIVFAKDALASLIAKLKKKD